MTGFLLRILYRSILFTAGYGAWLLYCKSKRRQRFPAQFLRTAGITCAVWLAMPLSVPVTFHYTNTDTSTTIAEPLVEIADDDLGQAINLEYPALSVSERMDVSSRLADVAAVIWAAGFLAVVVFHTAAYFRRRSSLYRWRTSPILQDVGCPEDVMYRKMRIVYTHSTSIPLVSGMFRPVIWLPDSWKGKDSIVKPALLHEVTHLRQGDLWIKWLLLWVKSLYWFLPAVYIFSRRVSGILETACDERALKGTSFETRREYSLAILAALEQEDAQKLSAGFLGLWEEENQVLFRIRRIMKPEKSAFGKKGKMNVVLGVFAVLAAASAVKVQAVAVPSGNVLPEHIAEGGLDSGPIEPPAVPVNPDSVQTEPLPDSDIQDTSEENTETRFHVKIVKDGNGGMITSYPANDLKTSVEYDLKNVPCQACRVAFPCNYETSPDLVRNELLFYANTGTEVFAIADEVVTDAGYVPLLGKCIATESNGFEIVYSHLDEINVEIGDTLKAGERIGLVGATGGVKHYMVGLRIDSKDGLPADLSEYGSGFEW